jgi:hypothetical protein
MNRKANDVLYLLEASRVILHPGVGTGAGAVAPSTRRRLYNTEKTLRIISL